MIEIDKNKYYSLRETAKIIPWVNCEPSLQKMIQIDYKEYDNKLFNAIVLKRKKRNRYFLKGESIIEIMKKKDNNEFNPDLLIKRRK